MEESAPTLKWLIQHECVDYECIQGDLVTLIDGCQGHSRLLKEVGHCKLPKQKSKNGPYVLKLPMKTLHYLVYCVPVSQVY